MATTTTYAADVYALLDAFRREVQADGYWIFELMKIADANGDSKISPHELTDMLRVLKVCSDDQTANALFSALDCDHSGTITVRELEAALINGVSSAEFTSPTQQLDEHPTNTALDLSALPTISSKMHGCHTIAEDARPSAKLEMQGSESSTDEDVCRLVKGCVFLEHANLSRTNLTDVALHALASNCPRLKVLSLTRCPDITNDGVLTLARRCKRLECVNLVGSEISSDVLNVIMQHNKSTLKAITLDANAGHLNELTLDLLLNECQKLEAIDVACTLDVKTDIIQRLVDGCEDHPSLKQLRFHGECDSEVAAFVDALAPEIYMHVLNHLSVPNWATIQVGRRNAVNTPGIGVEFESVPTRRRQSIVSIPNPSSKLAVTRVGEGSGAKLVVAG